MIELKEVTKQFDDFKVLDKISLTIPKRRCFWAFRIERAPENRRFSALYPVFIRRRRAR